MRNLILFFLLISFAGEAQKDTSKILPLVGVNFGGQLPMFDMSQRFGANLRAGGSFLLKTRGNWIFGLESNYLFGQNVREDVLTQLKTPEGYVIDNLGNPADIRVTERGLSLHLVGGKVIPFANVNKHSGILLCLGVGALQHKINVYDGQRNIAAIKGDLVHGYDRLSAGFSVSESIGYLFLSENRLLNFYFGLEFYQATTQSLRKLNYDTGISDTQKRLDGLAGFRIGWILPLYKKAPNEYYYY